jgi:hypothetical protein
MASLGLPHAKILHAEGFGRRTRTAGSYVLAVGAEGEVELLTAIGGRMAYRFPPAYLTIVIGDGGRSARAAIAAEGGAIGQIDSSWLAARDRRYGMLTLRYTHPDRAPAIVVLGFRRLTHGEVAQRLHDALDQLQATSALSPQAVRRLDPTVAPPPER